MAFKWPFLRSFAATFHYKGGSTQRVRGLTKLRSTANGWEWEYGGPDRIHKIGVDDIVAVHYTYTPIIVDIWYALWRKIP